MQLPFLFRALGLAQTIVNTGELIMRHRFLRVQRGACGQFFFGFLEIAAVL
jgi:hypothetical protein